MKGPSATQLAFGAVAVAALVLTVVGGPSNRSPSPLPETPPAAVAQVDGNGISITSATMTLPDETETLPPGEQHDLVAANCTACHSANMLTTQPALNPEQWEAIVKKMREVYHASIAEGDVPAILTYLNELSDRQRAAQSPAPSPAAASTAAPATAGRPAAARAAAAGR